MLGVGAYFYRQMRAMKDYFSGGNQIPWWLSGISFYMASFSAFAFVSYSALAYKYGWVAVTLFWVTVPAAAFGTVAFASRWRRARIDSPVEYLETRYSPALRQLLAWQGVPVKLIDDALKLVATAQFLSAGVGLDLQDGILWAGGIMLLYTFMGGLWAVAVTDFIQFVVLAVAVIILLPLAMARVGGPSGFVEGAPAGFFHPFQGSFDAFYFLSMGVLMCLSWSVNWGLVQKYYCVPTERDARKTGWLVVALNVIGPPLMFIPAMAARQFLPDLPDSQLVYPRLCAVLLPAGMMGLMLAGMFSATMSTLSSDYNVCASVLTNDVYRRLLRPLASDRELVRVGRIITLLIGVLSIGMAFPLSQGKDETLFRNMITLFSTAVPPVAIPMLWGLISPRLGSRAGIIGFAMGMAAGLLLFYAYRMSRTVELMGLTLERENLIMWASAAATIVGLIAGSRLFPQSAGERQRAGAFLQRLKLPIGALPQDLAATRPGAAMSPFGIVGASTLIIGLMMLAILPWVSGALARTLDLGIGLFLITAGAIMARYGRANVTESTPAPEPLDAVEDRV
jgi:SSS family transporter